MRSVKVSLLLKLREDARPCCEEIFGIIGYPNGKLCITILTSIECKAGEENC